MAFAAADDDNRPEKDRPLHFRSRKVKSPWPVRAPAIIAMRHLTTLNPKVE
jgi:hypothetical protein